MSGIRSSGAFSVATIAVANACKSDPCFFFSGFLFDIWPVFSAFRFPATMQVHKKRATDSVFSNTNIASDIPLPYRTRLSFYPYPPTEDVSLEEFERFAIDRLKGLSNRYTHQHLSTQRVGELTFTWLQAN